MILVVGIFAYTVVVPSLDGLSQPHSRLAPL
jgi:hypothetical protein